MKNFDYEFMITISRDYRAANRGKRFTGYNFIADYIIICFIYSVIL